MILVTGATGTIGRLAVGLLARVPVEVRALGRNPERLAALATHESVEIVVGDYEDADSVRRAVDGVEAVFAVVPAGTWLARHDALLLAAARAAGVPRVVKLSSFGSDRSDWPGPPWHRAGEVALQQLPEWTILRPSSFASNTLAWAEALRTGQPVPNPFKNGRQGVVDPRDVAAVVVEALTRPGHSGRTYTLTGPELLSVPEQAAVLSDVLDREVITRTVPVDTMAGQLRQSGADEEHVSRAEHAVRLVRRGESEVLTHDVDDVLGRPAVSFAEWARDHAVAFG